MIQRLPQEENKSSGAGAPNRVVLRWFALGVLIVALGVAAALVGCEGRTGEPEAEQGPRVSTTAVIPPQRPQEATPTPAVSPAEMLGLPPELPKDAEGLNREAFATCERLVQDLPNRPEAYAVAAFIFNRHGRTAEATRKWEEALEVNPGFAPAYCGIGIAAADNNEYEKATEMLDKSIELDPWVGHAHSLLVDVLLRQGKAEEALTAARRYAGQFPDAGDSHYWLGQAHLDLRQYEEARRSYEEAIRVEPTYTASYHSLATAWRSLGDRKRAAEYLKKFAELKEQDLDEDRTRSREYEDLKSQLELAASYHLAAGKVHLTFGKPEKAEAHWMRGAAIAPELSACREALVSYYEARNLPNSALAQLDQLVARQPQNPSYWTRVGRLHLAIGDPQTAEASFRKAIEVAPKAAQGHAALIELYLQSRRRPAETLALAEEAVKQSPCVLLYMFLSAAREQIGDRPGAIAAVDKAMKLEPDNPQIQEFYERLHGNKK